MDTFYLKVRGNFAVADPGEGPGGAAPPLFPDQTEARRAKKIFFGDQPPPVSKGLDDRPPPPSILSQGIDPALLWP